MVGAFFKSFYPFFYHKKFLQFIACENKIPTTCNINNCNGAQEKGACKLQWKDLSKCSRDTPGMVKDDCQLECGTCSGEFDYSMTQRKLPEIFLKVVYNWQIIDSSL